MAMLVYLAVPLFVVTMALEFAASRGRAGRGYEARDTAASLTLGVGNVAISALTKGATFAVGLHVYEHRLFELGQGALAWLLLVPAEDLCYYAFHRAHHELRFFWAAHVNHHSSRHYNLSTALRQSWTTPFTGPLFWLPLPLLGFHPVMVLTAQGVSLLYQYWLHTERIGRLGPLEHVLNTPSHHRVHHGRNPRYLDRNYGGILIVWDRLFGSFEPEREPVDFGLTKNLESFNPFWIAFHEWLAMTRDAARAGSLRAALGVLLHPPGWRPDGTGATARDLRRLAEPGEHVAA